MIHLVPARTEDLDFVYSCINTLEETVFDKEKFSEVYASVLEAKDAFLFVIQHNDEEVGYMSIYVQTLLHHCGKVAEVQELVILPEYRSSGMGKTAIAFAKKFAQEKGCVLIELASNIKREDAHRFYQNNGFVRSHYKFTCDLGQG